jgi:hypothetical protein
MTYSLQEQIQCVEREIKMRERVYRKRVLEGKMSQAEASYELNIMKQVSKTLRDIDQPELIP